MIVSAIHLAAPKLFITLKAQINDTCISNLVFKVISFSFNHNNVVKQIMVEYLSQNIFS